MTAKRGQFAQVPGTVSTPHTCHEVSIDPVQLMERAVPLGQVRSLLFVALEEARLSKVRGQGIL